jgi:DHA1 family putative efflux transporter-like MFS transporter
MGTCFSGSSWAVNYCICHSERHRFTTIRHGSSKDGSAKANDRFALDRCDRKRLDHHAPGVRLPHRLTNRSGYWRGVFVIAAKTIAAKLAPPGKQAGAIGTVIIGFSAALIVGVPIGRVIAATFDWKFIFVGIGMLSLFAVFAVYRMIPSTEGEVPIPLGKQIALIKSPIILTGFGITFFWQLGYAILYAYIVPFLLDVTTMGEHQISLALFAFGIATLVGSKFGGFLTDRIGIPRSLLGGMAVHVVALVLLSTMGKSAAVTIPLLMLWGFSAWSSGPGLQFNLVDLAPEASGIMLSLYGSVLQLSIAAAGGIGGLATDSYSVHAVSWTAAVSVAIAVMLAVISFGQKHKKEAYS